jgi:hypothetical protein
VLSSPALSPAGAICATASPSDFLVNSAHSCAASARADKVFCKDALVSETENGGVRCGPETGSLKAVTATAERD